MADIVSEVYFKLTEFTAVQFQSKAYVSFPLYWADGQLFSYNRLLQDMTNNSIVITVTFKNLEKARKDNVKDYSRLIPFFFSIGLRPQHQ